MVMLTPDYVKMMARYNAWQNESLLAAADTLDDAARRLDRGAFFGSVHGTLCHILWADRLWLSRFGRGEAPQQSIAQSVFLIADWPALCAARRAMDALIADWAGGLTPADLEGDLGWYSGAMGRDMARPRALLVVHVFNHATHHRGQVHAMLTAAGARPDDTDLPFMPGG